MPDIFWRNILAQDKAKNLLENSLSKQKVSHAYLFKGPSGVGKKRVALSFAALLNCSQTKDMESCGNCPSCRKLKSANHPDFLSIKPDGALLKINQIRQLKKDLSFPPFEAKFRVVLIADIHETMRRKEVANSLLKTLEEPPSNTIFILTTDESGGILATILSRCQVIPFSSLPINIVSHALCKDDVDPIEAQTLAAISEGSIGKARKLAKMNLLELRRQVVESLSAMDGRNPIAIETVFLLAERTAKLKEDLLDFLELLKLWIRDLMIIAAQGEGAAIINHDLRHTYSTIKDNWNLSNLSDKVERINKTIKEVNHNCNKTFACEVLYWGLID